MKKNMMILMHSYCSDNGFQMSYRMTSVSNQKIKCDCFEYLIIEYYLYPPKDFWHYEQSYQI